MAIYSWLSKQTELRSVPETHLIYTLMNNWG